MNIAVFGLGYVGIVNIACLSSLGHTVYGCDIKPHKVDLLNVGKAAILEPQVDDLVSDGLAKGRILASTDARWCIENTAMALVCVGTPSNAEGEVNLNYIMNTVVEIAQILKNSTQSYTLVVRSTIPPGTVEGHVIPAFKRVMGEAVERLKFAFLPEFLREGDAVKDFFECARIVAGVDPANSAQPELTDVFGFNEKIPLHFTDFRTAEFVKYVDNAYHATKVAFANEVYAVGSAMGVNVKTAHEIFLMDDILNISGRYLRPGMPFGGSCLPKDTRAMLHFGKQFDVDLPFFNGVVDSNKAHQKRLFDHVLRYEGINILIYGLTFKQNTDDIRESPFLFLLKDLAASGKDVKVYDEDLNLTSLRIEFPEIVQHIESDLAALVQWADTIIMNKKNFKAVLQHIKAKKAVLNCLNNEVYHYGDGHLVDNIF